MFGDDFGDGNASGWSTSGGSWSAASGAYRQSGTGTDAKAHAGTTAWAGQTMQAREAGGGVTEPSAFYAYTRTSVSQVPALVTAGAGAGRI